MSASVPVANEEPMESTVFDVDTSRFAAEVVDKSHEVPVVVDFWAAWCGPCRQLGPVLEQAVAARGGEVLLAKVDVDGEPGLAQQFGVRGIPAVKGFRDGRIVAEFVGAQSQVQVEAFLDRLVPSEADRLAAAGERLASSDPAAAERSFREALGHDERHRRAAIGLARLIVSRDPERAFELVSPHRPDPSAEEVAAQAELAMNGDDVEQLRREVEKDPGADEVRLRLGRALAAGGDHTSAIEELLEVVRRGGEQRDAARDQIVAVLRLVEDENVAADARRRLASALY